MQRKGNRPILTLVNAARDVLDDGRTAISRRELESVGAGAFFRPRDLEALGRSYRDLQHALEAGSVEQVARGLYRLTSAEPSRHHAMAAVAARAPRAILCLLSALAFHEIGTQLPNEVWIGIEHKARAPRLPEIATRVVRFSGASLHYGVTEVRLDGVPARITSPARTVVDCFRFQRRVGRDVALEALREALASRKATPDELSRAADVCRARSLLEPVLEMVVR